MPSCGSARRGSAGSRARDRRRDRAAQRLSTARLGIVKRGGLRSAIARRGRSARRPWPARRRARRTRRSRPLSSASTMPAAMSSTWQSIIPASGNILAGSLPVRTWSIMLPISEWSSGRRRRRAGRSRSARPWRSGPRRLVGERSSSRSYSVRKSSPVAAVALVDDLASVSPKTAARSRRRRSAARRRDRRVEHALGAADVGLVHRRVLGLRDADLVDGADVERRRRRPRRPWRMRVLGREVALDELAAELAQRRLPCPASAPARPPRRRARAAGWRRGRR